MKYSRQQQQQTASTTYSSTHQQRQEQQQIQPQSRDVQFSTTDQRWKCMHAHTHTQLLWPESHPFSVCGSHILPVFFSFSSIASFFATKTTNFRMQQVLCGRFVYDRPLLNCCLCDHSGSCGGCPWWRCCCCCGRRLFAFALYIFFSIFWRAKIDSEMKEKEKRKRKRVYFSSSPNIHTHTQSHMHTTYMCVCNVFVLKVLFTVRARRFDSKSRYISKIVPFALNLLFLLLLPSFIFVLPSPFSRTQPLYGLRLAGY